jgi:hypothetical protein
MATKEACKLSSVGDLLEHLRKVNFANTRHPHVRAWFRGLANVEHNLVPGVYRPDFPANEIERLSLERHLSQDFRVMSAGLVGDDCSEAKLYFLQQHYSMPTRLLDWSNNALAGLYFAVSSESNTDGALYIMDAYQLGPKQAAKYPNGGAFEGIATSHNEVFKEALHPIFRWQDPKKFPDFIIPIRPEYLDRRITLQRGCFTFHVPKRPELTEKENSSLHYCQIPAKDKGRIKVELAMLGIDAFSVYGDLDHLSERLCTAHNVKKRGS